MLSSFIRTSLNAKRRVQLSSIKRNFSNNNITNTSKKSGDFRPLLNICLLKKKRVSFLILMTVAHSSLFMQLPWVLKEVQRLANIQIIDEKNMNKDDHQNIEEANVPKLKNEDKDKNGSYLDKVFSFQNFDINKKENFIVYRTKEEIQKEYLNFIMHLNVYFILSGQLTYKRHMIARNLENQIAMLMRRKLYSDIFKKDYSEFMSKSINPNTVSTKIITNTSLVTDYLCDNIVGLLRGSIFVVGGMAFLTYSLPEMTIISTGVIGILGLSSKWFNSRIHDLSKERAESLRSISEYIGDQMSNIESLKLLNADKISKQKMDDILKENHRKVLNVSRYWGINISVLEVFGIGGVCSLLTYGSYQISLGLIPADKMMMIQYANYIGLGLRSLIYNTSMLKVKMGYYTDTIDLGTDENFEPHILKKSFFQDDRHQRPDIVLSEYVKMKINSIYNENMLLDSTINQHQGLINHVNQTKITKQAVFTELDKLTANNSEKIDITFENVTFGYSVTDILFRDFNYEFKQDKVYGKDYHQFKGIASPSGSGKSTIFNLITGLYKPRSGKVFINGKDVKTQTEIEKKEFLDNVGYLTQESQMFMDTIINNIQISNITQLDKLFSLAQNNTELESLEGEKVTLDQCADYLLNKVIDACTSSQCNNILNWQEEGLLTKTGHKGIGLSGGEIQRIALARLFFRDPKVCLLDEVTSAQDAFTVKKIVQEFESFLSNKTCLIITHKPETFSHMLNETITTLDSKKVA